ncbi:hypothetical protein LTR56_003204 [Elasticomyces elasticus]|nr:hypothetical protein LTR56_003204 [Elasticomyces elasticus]KAK4920864.1 hypothetical protein LTR49_011586 [Elasticomyces elasticus]KAK5759618.1 hypothetical protein LTS12_010311 [Elasticomyces elasticus]
MATKANGGASSLVKMAQTAILDDITKSVRAQSKSATFACGGTLQVTQPKQGDEPADAKTQTSTISPVQIRFGDESKGLTATVPATSEAATKNLSTLIETCASAAFGRGGEDVFDETYRKAGKLDTNQFVTDFCPYTTGIIDVVAQMLLPSIGNKQRGIKAELYKLNVYSGPTGKFKAHVDTPRDEKQFGSLVVCLPVAHEGGELIVRHEKKEVLFDWSTEDSNAEDAGVKWAAFYSDCEHEVFEVTAGHRITLTYNLHATNGAGNVVGNIPAGLLDPTQLPLYGLLKSALETPSFFSNGFTHPQSGRVLAMPTTHTYAHTSTDKELLRSSLKGADMAVYEVVSALGLECKLKILFDIEHEDDNEKSTSTAYMRDNPEDIYEADGGYTCEEEGILAWANTEFSRDRFPESKVTWVGEEKQSALNIVLPTYGNEASVQFTYSYVVLMIRIPSSAERMQTTSQVQEAAEKVEKREEPEKKKAKIAKGTMDPIFQGIGKDWSLSRFPDREGEAEE